MRATDGWPNLGPLQRCVTKKGASVLVPSCELGVHEVGVWQGMWHHRGFQPILTEVVMVLPSPPDGWQMQEVTGSTGWK